MGVAGLLLGRLPRLSQSLNPVPRSDAEDANTASGRLSVLPTGVELFDKLPRVRRMSPMALRRTPRNLGLSGADDDGDEEPLGWTGPQPGGLRNDMVRGRTPSSELILGGTRRG